MRILRVANIDIDLHWTFILLFSFVLLAGGFEAFALIVAIFGSVVLHELSHSIVAKMHGIKVRRIVLLPIGGMALIEDFAMSPNVELKVAIAGPFFSFALAFASFLTLLVTSNFPVLDPITGIASILFQANILIGVFNLLPALPLDGGRVWRALRQRHKDYLSATRDAVSLSKFVVTILFMGSLAAALLISAWGFLIWNTIIALFIFVGSNMEMDAAIFKTSSDGLFVRDVMRKKPQTISRDKTLREGFIHALASRSTSLILTGKGSFPSVVHLGQIERIPQREWHSRGLYSLQPRNIHVAPETPLIEAWKRMRGAGVEIAPVLHKNKLVGVIQESDIERLIYLKKIALLS